MYYFRRCSSQARSTRYSNRLHEYACHHSGPILGLMRVRLLDDAYCYTTKKAPCFFKIFFERFFGINILMCRLAAVLYAAFTFLFPHVKRISAPIVFFLVQLNPAIFCLQYVFLWLYI